MAMKIENWKTTLDTFTWPHNPRSIDIAGISNHEIRSYGPVNLNVVVASDGLRPRVIPLVGHFSGASKLTHYRNMAKQFRQTSKLKTLFWESDKFYLGIGTSVKQTNVGGRTNFIDYVASFQTIIGLVFSSTLDTSGTNDGNATTYVEDIIATVTSGASDATISDNNGTTITIDNTDLTSAKKVLYLLVWFVDSGDGIYVTEYNWVGYEVDAGTTTSDVSNKLVETGQNFETTVTAGDIVKNTTDNTFSTVIAVDSNTTLSLRDDIMDNSEAYTIFTRSKKVKISGHGRLRISAGEAVTGITDTNLESATVSYRDAWFE
jgi:hypothetical protein